jgi:glutamate-1-semialdehyde 2,1-aminomutase
MRDHLAGIDKGRLAAFRAAEVAVFAAAHPQSQAALSGAGAFVNRVPMHWMADWPLPFPLVVDHAKGARLTDVDGLSFDDFCLGDTGSMFGHSPAPVGRAIKAQAGKGLTYMLPTKAAMQAGELLADCDDGDRCQPLCPARGAGGDGAG